MLGVMVNRKRFTADWVVELVIRDDRSVVVGTSRWRTKDNLLINGKHHYALRTELLRAIGLGVPADEAEEDKVTAKYLRVTQGFEAPVDGPTNASFYYSPHSDLAAITRLLQVERLHRDLRPTTAPVSPADMSADRVHGDSLSNTSLPPACDVVAPQLPYGFQPTPGETGRNDA